MRPNTPSPLPNAGNQPRRTEKVLMSIVAATNAGSAASTVVSTRMLVSTPPGRSPASTPSPMPTTRMISDA